MLSAWALRLMLVLMPHASHAITFPTTATAIDRAAHDDPLFAGEEGVAKTITILIALAKMEGNFHTDAVGQDAWGYSRGLFQVHDSNLKRLHLTREDMADPYVSARAALWLLHESFRICKGHPEDEWLAHYATGRARCDVPEGLAASRARMHVASVLLARHPPVWIEPKP